MSSDLRGKAVRGMLWTGVEHFGTKFIQFLIAMVLARLLSPKDYGVIALLTIFIALANSFLDSGFSKALIQKKDRTEVDYSTVFYFNFVVACSLYALFFATAPLLADFYDMPILTDVTRVVTLGLIINGLSIVQTTKLTIELDFKTQSLATLLSLIVSGAIGIWMAYCGRGVWALVIQGIVGAIVRLAVIWTVSTWRPQLVFSKRSFRQLFGFGSKLLASSMISTVYRNVHSLIIGKFFSAADLGQFNRASGFASLPMESMVSIVMKVNYPILSSLQDDNEKLLNAYGRMLRTPVFFLYPLLLGMAVLAKPMIIVLVGAKWLPCVPYLQILCISYLWDPLTQINLNLLYVKGRSDLVLKLEMIKKVIAFSILFSTIWFGIVPFCIGLCAYNLIAFYLNCHYTGKLMNFGFVRQFCEVLPILLNSLVMTVVIWGVKCIIGERHMIVLIVATLIGMVTYVLLAILTKDQSLRYLWAMLPLRGAKT